jgi:hypothetical protein
MKLFFYFMAIL